MGCLKKYESLPIVALKFMQRQSLEGLSLQKTAGLRIGINGMPFRPETKASSKRCKNTCVNISHSVRDSSHHSLELMQLLPEESWQRWGQNKTKRKPCSA
jgi:hypothetical protein